MKNKVISQETVSNLAESQGRNLVKKSVLMKDKIQTWHKIDQLGNRANAAENSLNAMLDRHTSDGTLHVTADDKESWNDNGKLLVKMTPNYDAPDEDYEDIGIVPSTTKGCISSAIMGQYGMIGYNVTNTDYSLYYASGLEWSADDSYIVEGGSYLSGGSNTFGGWNSLISNKIVGSNKSALGMYLSCEQPVEEQGDNAEEGNGENVSVA